MSNVDEIAFLEGNLARQLGWIAAADAKATFVFAVDTAMLGVLAAVSPRSACEWELVPALVASLTVALLLASLSSLCFATFPRTKGPKRSLIYFGGVATQSREKFAEAVSQFSVPAYAADLAAQCHRNAEIAACKFRWVRRALASVFLSVLPWGATVFMLYNT